MICCLSKVNISAELIWLFVTLKIVQQEHYVGEK